MWWESFWKGSRCHFFTSQITLLQERTAYSWSSVWEKSCCSDLRFDGTHFSSLANPLSVQEERPWDGLRFPSWNGSRRRLGAGGHWWRGAQEPRGQIYLHWRPHDPENRAWLEHCQVSHCSTSSDTEMELRLASSFKRGCSAERLFRQKEEGN